MSLSRPGYRSCKDCVRVLTDWSKVSETRDVTWAAAGPKKPTAAMPTPPETAELGGHGAAQSKEGESTNNESDDDVILMLPMDSNRQQQPILETTTPAVETFSPPASPTSYQSHSSVASEATENSSSATSTSTLPVSRTIARQLAPFLSGPLGDDERREGRTRQQSRMLAQQSTDAPSAQVLAAAVDIANAVVDEQTRSPTQLELPSCSINDIEPEPTTYSQSLKSKYAALWADAREREFVGLCDADTFFEIGDLPQNTNIIDAKFVYKWKSDADGAVTKAKARLVAKGYGQVEGVDFFETHAATPAASSIRSVAAIACVLDLDLNHFDVEQAFVQSKLDSEVFMRLPPGCGPRSGEVVKLNKSLYGLKQASRQWQKRLTTEMTEIGFEQCLADPCVFRMMTRNELLAIVVVHVDDLMIAAVPGVCDVVFSAMEKVLPIKNLEELSVYNGVQVTRDRTNGILEMSQSKFIRSILQRFDISRSSAIPASPFVDLRGVNEERSVKELPFREVVGCLMWVANQTRPDIANAVRAVARFSHEPKRTHWRAALKVLEYLNETQELGLRFHKDGDSVEGVEMSVFSDILDVAVDDCLGVYVDADYANSAVDRRSVSGAAVIIAGSAVAWFSRTQKCVTLSTTEAEYVAMGDGVKEALFVRNVLSFVLVRLKAPVIKVLEDNEGAIALAQNPLGSANSKHIDVRHHFLREKVEQAEIELQHVASDLQHADILTKALPRGIFEVHRDFLLGRHSK